jgi:hypothetical protein
MLWLSAQLVLGIQENPTSAAVLAANIHAPNFNGAITYGFLPGAPATATDPNDQRHGDWTKLTSTNVALYATGVRNAYGLKVGIEGNVMLTVNGPNYKFGQTLTGVDASGKPQAGPDPESDDVVYVNLKEVRCRWRSCV